MLAPGARHQYASNQGDRRSDDELRHNRPWFFYNRAPWFFSQLETQRWTSQPMLRNSND